MQKTLLLSFAFAASTFGAIADSTTVEINDFSHETAAEKADRMAWFDDARFGMFIHWGLYAQPAGVWKGKDYPGVGEWIQKHAEIPVAEYEPLQKTFNPQSYDPESWVKLAKAAGMKYIVITTKHHDGFALYDSKYTDWDMGGTPYKKDLLKPLADACRKHGLRICWYHSIMDWHHPHYGDKDIHPWMGNGTIDQPDMAIYCKFMKDQLHELLTEYGDISLLWFDGQWEGSWTHEMGKELYDYCRTLQPDIIINNRVDKGRSGAAGMTKEGTFRGDYGTPEQEIPETGFGEGAYWESCMTMNDTWGFKSKDHNWKSSETLIRNLIDIASKGGNFLLNVGPTADGIIPQPSVERLQDIAKWMDTNAESIHGTSANPFPEITWNGRCTRKETPTGTVLYLHLFEWPENRELTLPQFPNKIKSATLMHADTALDYELQSDSWQINLPTQQPDPIASVIRVNLEGDLKLEAPQP
ncbi:alpha-L-fucosidase [Sulfuriroseicoccus oceanibius]|uniref:alpha-L-fucosidase n=1 Tax=Sulfuriroseicoccus oceanibius TaxID=2707525 RepID=A0A6B3L5B3_9BACT|nr:alpha-L-fucosidase [Sulfuriroseicoccus oceanibius]QQL44531.1 alpha-L-fucosidase [Sulfuriroseicoccus oceanibius]